MCSHTPHVHRPTQHIHKYHACVLTHYHATRTDTHAEVRHARTHPDHALSTGTSTCHACFVPPSGSCRDGGHPEKTGCGIHIPATCPAGSAWKAALPLQVAQPQAHLEPKAAGLPPKPGEVVRCGLSPTGAGLWEGRARTRAGHAGCTPESTTLLASCLWTVEGLSPVDSPSANSQTQPPSSPPSQPPPPCQGFPEPELQRYRATWTC